VGLANFLPCLILFDRLPMTLFGFVSLEVSLSIVYEYL
jgi:hypothetical protein